MSLKKRVTRRAMLKTMALAAPAISLAPLAFGAALNTSSGRGVPKNVILFLTDQERATQHFPPDWERKNLPGLTRLKRNGLSFENAFTNACMCSPARSTLMSGYFPAQHGVKYTLEQNMPYPCYPDQVELPTSIPNLATVMSASGFNSVYKGKWHCSKSSNPDGIFVPTDLTPYGWTRWNPQDAGANQDVNEGGGAPKQNWCDGNNDGRYMFDVGDWHDGKEGVLAYLKTQVAAQQPFFLVVSLVNPHDVLFFPNNYTKAKYDDLWLRGDIELPETVIEDLSTKPSVQKQFLLLSQGLGVLKDDQMKRDYLNFYGNLIKLSDQHLTRVLDLLDELGLTDDTLIIRTADHGEMGLAHDGLRQKNFNFYEESIRVPLVYSNPQLFSGQHKTKALVSHVDFLPTLAGLYNAPASARAEWQGVDYSSLILNPSAKPVQDYVVFTYDDWQSGQSTSPFYPGPLNRIASIREDRYKLAEYYDVNRQLPSQWEMYDLVTDPLETNNLANGPRNPHEQSEYERLQAKLAMVMATRLQPPA
jgi:arylsulfatase A-like enzyme